MNNVMSVKLAHIILQILVTKISTHPDCMLLPTFTATDETDRRLLHERMV